MMNTGTDIKQFAKWMVFIFIYSVYMPDVIWNTRHYGSASDNLFDSSL